MKFDHLGQSPKLRYPLGRGIRLGSGAGHYCLGNGMRRLGLHRFGQWFEAGIAR